MFNKIKIFGQPRGAAPTLILLSFLILLFIPIAHPAAFDAKIEDISNRAYKDVVMREINNAKRDIYVAMYSFYLHPEEKAHPINAITDALLNAHKRGVKVVVYLDSNDDNSVAFNFLKDNGIETYFIKRGVKMHAKLIVIDGETVIDGSANWTQKALDENFESNMLIRGKDFARAKMAFFDELKKLVVLVDDDRIMLKGVKVPVSFLENPLLGPRMVSSGDWNCFNFYLTLLKQFSQTGESSYSLSRSQIADRLGVVAKPGNSSYLPRIVRNVLRLLADKYVLIEYSPGNNGVYDVRLKPVNGDFFILPFAYWDCGLNKLRIGSQFVYLIMLREQGVVSAGSWWAKSNKQFAEKYHIHRGSFQHILTQLSDLDLIDIRHSYRKPGSAHNDKDPNQYLVKPLLSFQEKERLWSELKKEYGSEMVGRAYKFAQDIGENNDIDATRRFAGIIKEYGLKNVQYAVSQVAKNNHNNPSRSIPYVVGILQNMQKEGGAVEPND